MDKNEKVPTLIQCSQCESTNGCIVDNRLYVCNKCGFTREINTDTQEKEKMWPYTVEEWEFISDSQKKQKKEKELKDLPYVDWDDYPYIPVSQWLYRRH